MRYSKLNLRKLLIILFLTYKIALVDSFAFEDLLFDQFGVVFSKLGNFFNGPKITDVNQDQDIEEYDFIIVGGGTAGSIIANRLSEIPEWKILLLEAGIPENPIGEIPKLTKFLPKTQYNWNYQTTPQEHGCQGMPNNQCTIRCGKVLGGSSSISNYIYSRGSIKHYNFPKPIWNESEILKYYKKSEDCHLARFDYHYHGVGGPNQVEDLRNPSKFRQNFLESAKELNYQIIDYNGKTQMGFGRPQILTKRGKRNSVSKAYLEPLKERKNVVIKTESLVTEILINLTGGASGVKYFRDGKILIARSSKEVILSAGTINSAQILMLSGIGPKEALKNVGVDSLVDLKVGQNLRDHIIYLGLNFIYDKTVEIEDELSNFLDWFLLGKGPLTSIGIDVLGYINSGLSTDSESPDLELSLIPSNLTENQGFKTEILESLWGNVTDKNTFGIAIKLLQPTSVGFIGLNSNDIKDAPDINPRYLSENVDVEIILAGIKKALEIVKIDSFQKIKFEMNRNKVFGCKNFDFGTDDYWRCSIRKLQISGYDFVGTNKMGEEDDESGVVDQYLGVKGIKFLRVIDASVVPNTNFGGGLAPVIMLAEKGCEIIKEFWNQTVYW